MFTQSLIHIAILVYFSLSSAHGINFDCHAGTKAAAKTEEKVVLLDRAFCEKCVVASDVLTPLPKVSILSRSNFDQFISDFDVAYEVAAKYGRGDYIPAHEALPKRFDTLLSKVTPNAVNEKGGVGEIIATKLDLYPEPKLPQAEFGRTTELQLRIRDIGADNGLHHRIAKLTRGWQSTFQLPFMWDKGDSQVMHRNEFSPPIEETISYPDMPLWLSPSGDDVPPQLFSFFVTFLR